MAIQVTIIGLGQIGSSIGLCLADKKGDYIRIGHDRKPEAARLAGKLGAVDKTEFNLHKSVEKADIVILAIPVDEIRETIRQIAPDLKANAVILDTSFAMASVAGWVKELLPAANHFAAFAPGLNGTSIQEKLTGIDAARADLFRNSIIVISSPPGTKPETLQLASDLATLLGAAPLFADPLEFDGWAAAIHLLPQLAAASIVHTVMDQPGWRDARKLAGKTFHDSSAPVAQPDELKMYGHSALLNQAAILRLLDDYMRELETLRLLVEKSDQDGLQTWLGKAIDDRKTWFGQRVTNQWDAQEKSLLPGSGELFGRFFGIRPKKSFPGKKQ